MNTITDNRQNYKGFHILTADHFANTDTWESGLNNNVLIFGPSGVGKTRHYVKPNILNSHESMIISDTKGALYEELAPALESRGFRVLNIDFTDLKRGCGYNPLSYIRYDEDGMHYSEKDILTVTQCLIPDTKYSPDPFWERAARQYLACLIGYVLETNFEEGHTLKEVIDLLPRIGSPPLDAAIEELGVLNPKSTVPARYTALRTNAAADKMDASIRGILAGNTDTLLFDEALALYQKPDPVDFTALGREKTALFLTISDIDRSMDKLANTFMTQALQNLCLSADKDYPEHRLPVPVRLYLDDFATNLYIPDFDKIISVIRSREISVSVILQSLTQLDSLYGEARAATILSNCDRQLYLGGSDLHTANYISRRTNRPEEMILSMPLDKAWLLMRGEAAAFTEKYDITELEQKLQNIKSRVADATNSTEAEPGFEL